MKKVSPSRLAAVATGMLVAAVPMFAIIQPPREGLAALEYRAPGLVVELDVTRADQVDGNSSVAVGADLSRLGLSGAVAFVDGRTNRWATLLPSVPMIPGAGNSLTWGDAGLTAAPGTAREIEAAAWDAFHAWVDSNRDALRIDPVEFGTPKVTAHDGGRLVQIWIPRVVAGLAVRDSVLTAVINNGNLALFGVEKWGDVNVAALPTYSAAQAAPSYVAHVAPARTADALRKAHLEFVPIAVGTDPKMVIPGEGLEFRLAWVFSPRFDGSDADWEAVVDAHSGDLLSFEDKTNYVATARSVIGGVYPTNNTAVPPNGVLQTYPMPYTNIVSGPDTFFTDAGGNLQACVDGSVTTTLDGPYIQLNDICGATNESGSAAVLDLGGTQGTAPHDCAVPGGHSAGDTASARSAFYEINKIAELARGQLPNNPWIRRPLPVNVNIIDTCNANGGAGQLNFFRSGGGCGNTGELAGVFDHEWGHGMDASDAAPGISNPGEGIADIYASLRINESCMGQGFFLAGTCAGYGDPCTTCSGVRDIDYAKHTSGIPFDITRMQALCPAGGAPCSKEVHCAGYVYGEAVWDLWNRDLTGGAFNWSVDTSRELATRLTFTGGQLVSTWYQCVQGSGGCLATSGYMNYLVADDDDGNLANGTPHMTAIHSAFDRHGIACAAPTVQDSGCAGAPTSAPTVSTVALDRGAIINWTPVAGATSYRVFRTEGVAGCAFGKTMIGETAGVTWTDTDGLANGRTYDYMVMAKGSGNTCFGPASSCSPVVPATGANLAILPGSSFSIFGGDNDDFPDNCETARVLFTVNNIGTGSLTNVRVETVSSPSHPAVNGSISFPPNFASSLAACGAATGGFDFVGTSLAPGDTVVFDVEVTSDELAPATKTVQVSVPFAESDLQFTASKTFTFETDTEGWAVNSGVFNRSGAGGGNGTTFSERSTAALNDECDKIRSPLMGLSPTSTLSLWNNYDIEPFSGGTWYDRANVALEELDGSRTVVTPSSGRAYNAANGGPGTYTGCNNGEPGWAATQATWGTSSWTAAAFGQTVPNGTLAQVEVTYATDAALAQTGFWFDEVTVTDVSLQVADTQSNSCTSNFIFADDFESAGTSFWSTTQP